MDVSRLRFAFRDNLICGVGYGDTQDIYVEKFKVGTTQYEVDGKYENAKIHSEDITIKGRKSFVEFNVSYKQLYKSRFYNLENVPFNVMPYFGRRTSLGARSSVSEIRRLV